MISKQWRERLTFTAMSVVMSGVCGAQHLTGPHPTGAVPAPVALDTHGQFQEKFARAGGLDFRSKAAAFS